MAVKSGALHPRSACPLQKHHSSINHWPIFFLHEVSLGPLSLRIRFQAQGPAERSEFDFSISLSSASSQET